jgi:LacI family transcriptional regulator
MTRRATLRDVAELAGVSIKTISRVVNGTGPVAETTEHRVRAAIDELGFRPNPAARSLRVGHDDAVGLVIENIADPFMATLTAGIESRIRAAGKLVIITSGGYEPENERAAIESLAHRRVAGMIVTPTSMSHSYLAQGVATVPLVFVDRPPIQFDTDTVLSDNEGGARLAAEHLIAHGHERIAFVGDRIGLFTTSLRYQGFRAALTAAGLPVLAHHVRTDVVDPDSAAAATREMLAGDDPPTAIISANARSSLGVIRGLHEEPSSMVAHVSFEDFEGAESLSPPVTVVHQDPIAMGRTAADLMLERLDDPSGPPRHIVLPTRLIVRGSGELPPCDPS